MTPHDEFTVPVLVEQLSHIQREGLCAQGGMGFPVPVIYEPAKALRARRKLLSLVDMNLSPSTWWGDSFITHLSLWFGVR
jgi:hypothetical protein